MIGNLSFPQLPSSSPRRRGSMAKRLQDWISAHREAMTLKGLIIAFLSVILCSCQGGNKYRTLSKDDRGNNHYKGHYKVGNEYTMKNKTYKPQEVTSYSKVGIASWYGSRHGFHGKKTSNGDVYNKNMLTAAHRELPLPCLVKVQNLANGKSVIVLVNDRGPASYKREIDVSEKAAIILGMKQQGIAKVKVQYLHEETKQFLKTLGLQKKHGSRAKKPLKNSKCTVNCHIQEINLKHKTGQV